MTYTKISIPKRPGGGAAVPKRDIINIYDANDIAVDAVRHLGETVVSSDIVLAGGASGLFIQADRPSISAGYENSGDVDAKVFTDKVEFDYPGDTTALNNFIEAFANHGVVIIVQSCDAPPKIFGRKCNPLSLSAEPTDSKDAQRSHLVFSQEFGDRYLPRVYTGIIPAVLEESLITWRSEALWDGDEEWISR